MTPDDLTKHAKHLDEIIDVHKRLHGVLEAVRNAANQAATMRSADDLLAQAAREGLAIMGTLVAIVQARKAPKEAG